MRVLLAVFLALGLTLMVGVAADNHSNSTEKKASDEITISQPVRIGSATLPAGRYRIACNKEQITFEQNNGKEKFSFPCRGKDLGTKATATEVHLNVGPGEAVVSKVLLRGSNVEHVF